MTRQSFTTKEIVEIGTKLYRERLRDEVELLHRDRFLVMDIVSGDYEIDDRDILASQRLLERHPDGVLYGVRIGHSSAYRLGSTFEASSA